MKSSKWRLNFEKIIVYAIIAVAVYIIIILGNTEKLKQPKKDHKKVELHELTGLIDKQCDERCLKGINDSITKFDSVYEYDVGGNEIKVLYDINKISINHIRSSINVPINIISDDKVAMRCPEQCAYCDSETGICKSFS